MALSDILCDLIRGTDPSRSADVVKNDVQPLSTDSFCKAVTGCSYIDLVKARLHLAKLYDHSAHVGVVRRSQAQIGTAVFMTYHLTRSHIPLLDMDRDAQYAFGEMYVEGFRRSQKYDTRFAGELEDMWLRTQEAYYGMASAEFHVYLRAFVSLLLHE